MNEVLIGNVIDVLKTVDEESVQTCITSPPYWGLRKYDIPDVVWDADPNCQHEWVDASWRRPNASGGWQGGAEGGIPNEGEKVADYEERIIKGETCVKCGAWKGQLGHEYTPDLYILHLVEVFREVRRVLRDDGTLWLNLGDSYSGVKFAGRCDVDKMYRNGEKLRSTATILCDSGLKPKDLCMIPFRTAMALQADGWYLRSVIPWIKMNCMPESCNDRPTNAVEYIFLLAKSEDYFYDGEAIKVGKEESAIRRTKYPRYTLKSKGASGNYKVKTSDYSDKEKEETSRHRRTSDWFFDSWRGLELDEQGNPLVMLVNPRPYSEAHFAVFPEKLVEPLIMAGTSEKGCCPRCGKPWERILEREGTNKSNEEGIKKMEAKGVPRQKANLYVTQKRGTSRTIGWQPSCGCCQIEPEPCVVLDPFIGSGTVGKVAKRLKRDWLGIDLGYEKLSEKRIEQVIEGVFFNE